MPGVTGNFNSFNSPSVNDSGQVAFGATGGLWSEGSGTLTRIAANGGLAPGMGSATFNNFGSARQVINDSGYVAFAEGTSTVTGYFSSDGGTMHPVAVGNGPAAGVPGATFTNNGMVIAKANPRMNNSGANVFTTTLNLGGGITSANDTGVWMQVGGVLSLVARRGNPVPNSTDNYSTFGTPVINSNAQIALIGNTSVTGSAIFEGTVSGLNKVAARGQQAPGYNAGVNYYQFFDPAINDSGALLFRADVGSVGLASALYHTIGGTVQPVLRTSSVSAEADAAPGVVGATMNAVRGSSVAINNQNVIAFYGQMNSGGGGVTGTNDEAIWVGPVSALRPVAREGDLAPGAGGARIDAFSSYSNLSLNDRNQVALIARLTGDNVTAANNAMIAATDPFGQLISVVREGQTLEVRPGVFRTINDSGVTNQTTLSSGPSDGKPRVFGDDSYLALKLDFTDNSSGIFVADVGNVVVDAANVVNPNLVLSDGRTYATPNRGSVVVGSSGSASLTVSGGSSATAGTSFEIGRSGTATGAVTLSGLGSTLNVGTTLAIGGASASAGGHGSLHLGTGTSANAGGSTIVWGAGELNISGGSLTTPLVSNDGEIINNGVIHGGVLNHAGGVLSGNGTVLGNLEMQSASILAPGNSPGMLTADTATWQGGAIFELQFNDALGSAGTLSGWDLLHVNGLLTLQGGLSNPLILRVESLLTDNSSGALLNFYSNQAYSWTFASAGAIVGFDPNAFVLDLTDFANPLDGGHFYIDAIDDSLRLNFQPQVVPEPSSFVLASIAITVLAWGRSRRTKYVCG